MKTETRKCDCWLCNDVCKCEKDTHITIQELSELGFQVVKSYPHDDFVTQRRQKGCITIETTWQMPFGNFESQDMTIELDYLKNFSRNELKTLDKILNKNHDKKA